MAVDGVWIQGFNLPSFFLQFWRANHLSVASLSVSVPFDYYWLNSVTSLCDNILFIGWQEKVHFHYCERKDVSNYFHISALIGNREASHCPKRRLSSLLKAIWTSFGFLAIKRRSFNISETFYVPDDSGSDF